MVIVCRRIDVIHISRIPFVLKGRHGINAPVKIYSEFRVAEPFGGRVAFLEGFPIGGKRLFRFGVGGFILAGLFCAAGEQHNDD